ncbi:iron complex transport system permease protein [Rubritalea squalenifaciens DSM 18772]|uniref:Iron complex transport system permease protein n=1 Tax=Rubritalea squalenifaciens DSM 18772 TaxID=1123071 RepID=A0A1M6H8C4_9BACT|nr:iron ABC transporter permease [Rubritalea squalenifaciens]SHJ18508.1 iron complex transport system permease protein [Rubritalea squalenifaciens DSM 18772]
MKKLLVLLALAVLTLLVAPHLGHTVLEGNDPKGINDLVFREIRVPRVLMAFLCGMGLSLGGLVFQAMFRNSLATPFTLGVASGSTLGVALWVMFGIQFSLLGISGLSLAALAGALVSILLVYGMARVTGGFSPLAMLLGGVVLSFFFSSLTLLVQHFADAGSTFRVMRWLMGNLGGADYEGVWQVLPFVLSGMMIVSFFRNELDLLSLGDELAQSRGVEVDRVRKVLFFAVSLMVAGVMTVCGPIGFVGIMVPHFCRMLFGVSHRNLVWASVLLGGIFLVWCDTLARSISVGGELPVGVLTALLGGPFFLWLLVQNGGRGMRY